MSGDIMCRNCDALVIERDALAAECAKLREALRACVDLCDIPVDDDYSERCHAAWKQARAALAAPKP